MHAALIEKNYVYFAPAKKRGITKLFIFYSSVYFLSAHRFNDVGFKMYLQCFGLLKFVTAI